MTSAHGQPAMHGYQEEMVDPEDISQGNSMVAMAGGPAPSAKSLRKRTKTGCLSEPSLISLEDGAPCIWTACRRRRIKCGEERPICNNCVKSKRNCEGYNQRVIFKDNASALRPGDPIGYPDAALSYHHPEAISGASHLGPYETNSNAGYAGFPTIAPRPPGHYAYAPIGGLPPQPVSQDTAGVSYDSHAPAHGPPSTPTRPQYHNGELPPQSSDHAYNEGDHRFSPSEASPGFIMYAQQPLAGTAPYGHWRSTSDGHSDVTVETTQASISHDGSVYISSTPTVDTFPVAQAISLPVQPIGQPIQQFSYSSPPLGQDFYTNLPQGQSHGAGIGGPSEAISPSTHAQLRQSEPIYPHHTQLERLKHVAPVISTSEPTSAPFVRYVRDVPSRKDEGSVGSETDDDMDLDLAGEGVSNHIQTPISSHDGLKVIMALQAGRDDRPVRTFTDFLDQPNMLATYRPSAVASPLMDVQTARIFGHFITATGPSISIYERYPANPSVLLTGALVPASQQNLWTYAIPAMALSSPPLMHAILALASLHISKLQGGSAIPSLKHYHMALRRVAKCVGTPSKRGDVATLAATLLLGYWEVMAADSAKWNSHLLGARQLLVETDFSGMTKQIRAARAQKDAERRQGLYSGVDDRPVIFPSRALKLAQDTCLGIEPDVDEGLVGLFMGRKLRYDEFGRIVDDTKHSPIDSPTRELTTKDVEEYEVRRDLFWWFSKQDSYQSCLSGNGLLSDYSRWGDCPPRAAIGRREAPYGSTDHLVLLMGRIADFSAKDQRRKKNMMERMGGRWRPPPGMDVGPAPQGRSPDMSGNPQNAQGTPQSASSTGSFAAPAPPMAHMPVMYGMVPSLGPSKMPPAFQNGGGSSPESQSSDGIELEAATVEAEDEWKEIKRTLQVFEECLGPSFQPLSAEHMQAISTPFGSALNYKTYSIACMWAMYHMAHIVLHRAHPSMPPMAMMAAGVAAKQTAQHANEIGRIAAGLYPADHNAPITPALGAALSEVSMALFFAGVQYQDPVQRVWTANTLRAISRQTGWHAIEAIASGCEAAWEKAAQMGRGPAYVRMTNPTARDDRLRGRPLRSIDDDGTPGMRVHYAQGILGVEEDLAQMGLNE
ncbi:MAG: hypothetical protein M1816_000144 [Peltula sp. TS41687]|nr:MAG: hypothetical protein M1816_000144 [Peltula sp. TS41687]